MLVALVLLIKAILEAMVLQQMVVPQEEAEVLVLLDKQVVEVRAEMELGTQEMAEQEYQFLLVESQCGTAVVAVAVVL